MKKKILNFFTVTLGGMANGLFATLIVGTIFATIGLFFTIWDNSFCNFMAKAIGADSRTGLAFVLQVLTGAGIGVGVALSLKLDTLKTICLAAVGEIAAFFSLKVDQTGNLIYADALKVGDPLTIYLVVISVALLIKLILRRKTSVDILIVPLLSGVLGLGLSLGIRYPSIYITFAIQWLIAEGTLVVPFLMGIIVAVLMGMALTAPISSAAIGAIIFVASDTPSPGLLIASGAAIIGCSTQMVGFAIQSRRDNNIGQVISIGIGTSMLQFKNILRKPIIWLPTIIASAILGPISTCWLKLKCMGAASGMGTAGLVGQIGTFASMGNTWQTWVGIFVLQILAPIILVFFIDLAFRKFGLIKDGDFSLKREEE